MALYLYPVYHDIRAPRPWWGQVSDHYFYVVYSLVALGVITVFEWDFFFPDRLDIFVLSVLPVKEQKVFLARVAAIGLFVAGFLFDSNFLAPLVLPAAMDPPNLWRFLAAHLLAVTMGGIFAASFVLALQGILLSMMGERLFHKVSLLLQGLVILLLLTLLLLTPVLSAALPDFMYAKSRAVLYFPPFWFLGIYQRICGGPSTLPVFAVLAQRACMATALMLMLAVVSYPLAYRRRTSLLAEGSGGSGTHGWLTTVMGKVLTIVALSHPTRNAIGHFIGQTLLRVPRYRIYMVMYGGLGLALIGSSVLRVYFIHGAIHFGASPSGLRAAIPITAFWSIAGLRTVFQSPADRKGSWIFRMIQGKPGREQLMASRHLLLLCGLVLTLGIAVLFHFLTPHEWRGVKAIVVQVLTAIGLCVLLTDLYFLNVRNIPFTGVRTASPTHLASVMVLYLGFFPLLILLTLNLESWMDAGWQHIAFVVAAAATMHVALRTVHQSILAAWSRQVDLDDDQEEFPQTLGLRY
jgi:hypothetical protein